MKNYTIYRFLFLLSVLLAGFVYNTQAQCPSIANATFSSTDVTCFGANDGTVTVTLGDGTAPFNYFLFDLNQGQFLLTATKTVGPANQVIFSDLGPSDYIVQIRKIGCPNINIGGLGITVNEPAPLDLTITSQTNITGCFGDATGSFQIAASGGNGGYTYSFNGGAFGATTSFTNLTAGTYPVEVKDSKNCTQSISVVITQPTQLAINITSQTNPDCNGNTTGSIIVTASGGTPVYEYAINGGSFATASSFTNLVAGAYSIQVRDSKGCLATLPTITLTDPPVLTISLSSKTDITTCFGDATGEIVTSVNGGTPAYTFSVNGSAFTSGSGTFSNLTAGTYNIQVRDSKGCTTTLPTVTIIQPTQVAISLTSKTDITGCFGDASGEIIVAATGGTPAYEYAINGAAFASATTFSNLTAGAYTIQVRDSKGCVATLPTVTITQPTALVANISAQTNPSCFGNSDGNIVLSVSGGTPVYEYAINGGSFATASSFTNLVAGNYIIQVRDSKGCLATLPTITLTDPPVLTISLSSKTDITTCFGDATGEIITSVSGGTPAYTFSVNGSAFASGSGTFSNLTAGVYNIQVRDSKGCTTTLPTVTITQPVILAISLTSKTDITGCFGDASGEIVVAATGGTPAYEYAINGAAFASATTFSNLTAGAYSIQVRDSKGCLATLPTITITQPTQVAISLTSKTDITGCFGDATGEIQVAATGGTAPYAFSVNGAAFASTTTFNNLVAGTYSIQVRDSKGCLATLPTVTITQPVSLAINLSAKTDVTTCFGDASGSIITGVTGGTAPYVYSVNAGTFAAGTGSFANLTAGTYNIQVRDSKGCLATLPTVTITQPTQVAISLTSKTDITSCFGDATGEIVVAASGGTPAYEYAINGAAFSTNSSFNNLTAGAYSIQVRDSKGCLATLPTVTITQPTQVAISLTSKTDITSCFGDATGEIVVAASGGTPAYEYAINGAAFSTNSSFNNLVAGAYNIQVRDSKGCLATLPTVTITQPVSLAISLTAKTDITCNGGNNGSITVSATGGTALYTYSVNAGTFGSSNNFTNLIAGAYTIQVRDSKGCLATLPTVTITEPVVLAISLNSKTDIIGCFGDATGEIVVAATGGTAPYTYSVNGSAFGAATTFSNLIAGAYSIQVRDSKGCVATLPTVTIAQPAILAVSLSAKTDIVGCFGDATGSISTNVTGGTAPYVYSVNAGTFAAGTGSFANLTAGTYNVQVRDSKGCTTTLPTVTITQPTQVAISLTSKTDITGCNGDATGEVVVSATGGTPAYEFSINGSAFASASTFSNLTAGTYNIQVRDSKGCVATLPTVTITQPTVLQLSLSSQNNPTCFAATDGNITVSAIGGTAPYVYSVNGAAFASSNSFTNLIAGAYSIQVRDSKGCLSTLPTITLTEPAVLAISLTSKTDITGCNGDATGEVVVSATGGTPIYEFSINGSAFASATTFSNLTAGTYNIQVRDSKGCTTTLPTVTITQPTQVVISLTSKTDITGCFGDATGEIIVAATGGTAPYTYSVDGSAFASPSTFSNLTAGTYNIQVRDSKGCLATLSTVAITQPSVVAISLTAKTDITCNGGNNGSITVSATGGTAPYTYSVNAGTFASSNSFANLTAGAYTIQVRDSKGCMATLPTVTITEPAILAISLTIKTDVTTCNGSNNGSVTVSANGGNAGYTYSINGSAFTSATTFSNLTAGTYNIQVKDANGCLATLPTVTITQPAILAISLSSKTDIATCNGDATGEIVVAATGGTAPYTYSVNGSTFASSSNFTNLVAGTYNIQVRDSKGCTTTLPTVTITQPVILAISLTSKTDVIGCFGDASGEIIVAATGGTAPYTYSVNGSTFASATTFSNLIAGNYSIQVRDSKGCIATLPTVTITQPVSLSIALVNQTNPDCNGNNTGTVTVSASGGTSPYTYSINGGTFINSASFNSLAAGTYNIQVKDAKNCIVTLPTVTLINPVTLAISVSAKTNPACNGDNSGSITVTANGGTPNYQYAINGGSFVTSNVFNNLSAGTYNITVKDINNCTTTVSSIVLTAPSILSASITAKQDVSCNGASTGSLTVTATGGMAPYTYSVNGGTFVAGTGIFGNLTAGTYTIQVKDANGCLATLPATTIAQPGILNLVVSLQTNINACAGNTTGQITVTATGGTSPYTYSIDGTTFVSSNIFNNLTAGNYTIQAKDANNCTQQVNATITNTPSTLTASINSQNPSCNAGSDGSITISNVTGGSGNYEYSLDGTTFQTAASFSALLAGNYTVTIRDKNTVACSTTLSANLTNPTLLTATITSVDPTSCTSGNGTITVSASGGTSPYTYAINGSAFASSNSFTNLSSGNYNIIVKDAKGCTFAIPTETLDAPGSVNASLISKTDISCNGSSTGFIEIAAVGGVSPYSYSLDGVSFQASASFASLLAGTYANITIKDANGCLASLPAVTLTQPALLAITLSSSTNPDCSNPASGSILTSVTGGTAPYTYSVNGSAFSSGTGSFASLTAGSYDIIAKDANGCSVVLATVSLTPASSMSATLTGIDPSACSASDGSITISASGGTTPYSYSLDDISYQTSTTFSTLPAATYSLYIQDATGCKITRSHTLTAAGGLTANFTPVAESGCTVKDGLILVSGQNGAAGPYSYFIDGVLNPGGANNNVFSGLSGNSSYLITIEAANGCSFSQSVLVGSLCSTPVCSLTASLAKQDVSCNGVSDGLITVSVSGGSGSYEYSLDGVIYQNSNIFSALVAGSYTITVRDKNDNTCQQTRGIVLTAPAGLTATVSGNDPSGCSIADGSITVSVPSGGTAPYSYSLDGVTFQASGSFSALADGTYSVYIKDAKGCQLTQTQVLTSPSGITASAVAQDVTCNGASDGSITVTANGGSGNYEYSIDNGTTFQNSNSFSAVGQGSYTITVRDKSSACLATVSQIVSEPLVLAASFTKQDVSGCNGGNNGSITLTASGGTAPYSYSLDGVSFQASQVLNNLVAGTYSLVTIKDAKGCSITIPAINISQPIALSISLSTPTNISCNGASDGQITVSASGGIGPYTYSIDGTTFVASAIFNNLSVGSYDIIVKDANSCTDSLQNIILTQPAAINASLTFVNPTGCATTDGSIAVATTTGGTAPYTYSIDGTTFQVGTTFANLSGGSYIIYIKDSKGCTITQSQTITSPTGITASSSLQDVSCHGANDGSITVTANGGSGSYEYSLDGTTFQNGNSFSALVAGSYTITIRDKTTACLTTIPASITQPAILTVNLDVKTDVTGCNGAATGSITVSASGGTSPYAYSINGSAFAATSTFTNLIAGTYDIEVKDAKGCTAILPAITLTQPAVLTASISSQSNPTCFGNANGSIIVTAVGGVSPYSYSLDGVSFQANASFASLPAGTYANITIKDANGCLASLPAVTLTQPALLAITLSSSTNPDCSNPASGSILTTVSGGTVPYTYSVNGSAFNSGTGSFTSLTAGSYDIMVKDANGCSVVLATVSLTPASSMNATLTGIDPSACSASDGSITISASGGTTPYSYSLDDISYQTSTTFSVLADGPYTLYIQDATGCKITRSHTLTAVGGLTANFTPVAESGCTVKDGLILVSGQNGATGPYTYFIDGVLNPGGANNNVFTGLAGGNNISYLIRIEAANGCSYSEPVKVGSLCTTPVCSLTASLAKQDVSCNGANDGLITVSVSGGSGNYEYSLDGTTFQNGNSFSALSAGNYTITIRDKNDNTCLTTVPVTLTAPAVLTASVSGSDPSSCSIADGSIIVSAPGGGTAPYSYSLDGVTFQASGSFSALADGSYSVYIKDAKGCQLTRPQVLTSPSGITASAVAQDVTCNGANDGTITVTANGGSGNYEYSLDGTTFQNGNSFTALVANNYTITVRDKSSACVTTVSQVVTAPVVLAASFTKQDVSGCNGNSNGSITLTASGGTAPYSYSLDGVSFQASNVLNNLVAATYSLVTIKDAKGCSITVPAINISQPNALQASISDTDPTGCITTDGSLIVTASGGSGSYEYSIDGVTFQASATFSNLGNGTYTIIIRDKNNTSCTIPENTILSNGGSLTATPTVTDETTCQAKDGKITVNVTGGTAPYQYFLGSSTTANAGGNVFNNLTPGSYSIRVVSSDNCQFVLNNVTVNAATCTPVCNLTATLKSTAVVCNGQANGTVQVIIVSGGSGSYEYSIDNGANYQNSPSFTNLAKGTYTISVRDKNNLTCTASFVADPVGTNFFVSGIINTIQPPACSNRGSIEFRNVGGGVAPYLFSVDGINFQSDSTFANLLTGTYQATIKDANNCQFSLSAPIGGAAPVSATAVQTAPISCNGAADGQITVTATSGTGPYQYAINSGSFAAGNGILTNLAASTYSISVRDASNCIFNLPAITLTAPAAITASISAQANPACSTNNGSITVTASGGTGTLMYSKDNGVTFVTNGNFTGLSARTYTIVVKDANNCTVKLPAVTLTLPVITANINGTDPNSCTASNGSITVSTPTGGTAPYMYSLNGGAYQTTVTFSGLASGNYTITVKDANDCQITLTKSLNSSGGITALSIAPAPETACGINDGKITVSSVTGAAGPYEYYIDGVANPAGINASVFTGLTPKTYTIKVVAANGCIFTTTSTVNASCTPNCNLTAILVPTNVVCNGQSNGAVNLVQVSGGSGNYEYSINGSIYQPTPKFDNLAYGDYTITVRDKNNLTCTSSFIAKIRADFNVAGLIEYKNPTSCNEKGSITFTRVSGGQSAYSFSIDGTTFQADTLYDNLDAGTYQATIRDANNCIVTSVITIKNVLPIAAQAKPVKQVSCNGGSDGIIRAESITGGTGTYVYSLDGTTFTGSPEFTNLKAGLYTIYVKDQNGTCINSFPVTLTEPAILVANPVIVKQPGNCSAKDGEIKLDVTSGGTAPFEYKLNNGNYQTSGTFAGLDGGNYTITLRDASGCISTFTASLSVSNTITAQAIQVSPTSCNGNPDGEAQVNVITGSGSYEFSKDGITYQASNTFTGLKAGTYLLYVKDKNTSCIASSSVTIDGAIQITANIPAPVNPSTCIAKDGKIQINSVNGGSGNYQFSLDSLNNFQSGTLPFEFTGLSNGSYKVYIKDSKGCYGIYAYTLASPNSVVVGSGITITPPTCKGSNNGKLDINPAGNNVTGGQLPYQYSLDGITYQSTSAFNSLLAGKYTVSVKEASGCIYVYNYEITEPAGIEFVVQEISGAGCGETTGSVKVQNIKGGISPYTFSLDNINYQSDSLFTGLTAGSFKMYVKDASGQNVCENVKPFNVSGAMPLTFKVSTENIGCEGGNKGKIIIKEIVGGLSAENTKLRFSINNGKTFRDESASEVIFDNLAPGLYQLIINYGKNFACGTKMQEVRITSAGIPFVVDTVAATCGSPNGMATAVVAGGGNYFYSIDSLNYFQTPQFEHLKPGLYKMYVKESANDKCLNIQPFIIPGPDSLKYDLVKENCFDIRLNKIRGGVPPYRVSLDGGATFVSGNLFSNTYTAANLLTGDYQVVIVDSKGCTTLPIRVKIDNRIVAKVKATLSLPDEPTGEIRISDIRGGNAPYEVSIDGISWGLVKDKTLPIDTIITTQPMGKYTVYIRDASGCVKEYDTEIKESKFTIPNVFTPNGDGVNDTFFIRNLPAGTFVTISNRWGKVVYTSSDYQNDWNGGSFPDGVYYYTVNIAASGSFTGWVQIWR